MKIPLGPDYWPTPYTVLCGRGKFFSYSSGNLHLKNLVNLYLKPYSEASTREQKSIIVTTIVMNIKHASPHPGCFVKFEEGQWWEVDDVFARDKVGSMFRNCLHSRYRSSNQSKNARRKLLQNQRRAKDSQSTTDFARIKSPTTLTTTENTSSHPIPFFEAIDFKYCSTKIEESTILNQQSFHFSWATALCHENEQKFLPFTALSSCSPELEFPSRDTKERQGRTSQAALSKQEEHEEAESYRSSHEVPILFQSLLDDAKEFLGGTRDYFDVFSEDEFFQDDLSAIGQDISFQDIDDWENIF